ncbi:MAG: hypothetical protein ACREPV_08490 [Lysobacter sp.]
MKHADFAIGIEFETCTGQRWRCTDVGQRTVLAIELRPDLDEAWFHGLPYPVPEVVFDEHDIASAFRSHEEAIRDRLAEANNGLHPGYPNEAVTVMREARYPDDSRRYPHPRLLRIDRVDAAGEILHPYAAEPTCDGWRILLYAPFTEVFSALPETDFVRLPPATSKDFEARKRPI